MLRDWDWIPGSIPWAVPVIGFCMVVSVSFVLNLKLRKEDNMEQVTKTRRGVWIGTIKIAILSSVFGISGDLVAGWIQSSPLALHTLLMGTSFLF